MKILPSEIEDMVVHETMFPGCCGIHVLHEADYQDKGQLLEQLQKFIQDGGVSDEGCATSTSVHDGDDYNDDFDHRKPGLLLACFSGEQPEMHEVFQKLGFQVLAEFTSPTTKNNLTLYGLVLNQPKAKAPAKKKPKKKKAAKA